MLIQLRFVNDLYLYIFKNVKATYFDKLAIEIVKVLYKVLNESLIKTNLCIISYL